jgi:hypothetical protein
MPRSRARCAEPGYSNRYHLDLAAAIVALVGHPCIVLADAPEQFVDLTEARRSSNWSARATAS